MARTALFTAIVPGVVAGYVPLRVIGRDGKMPHGWSYIGVVPVVIGLVIYGWTAFDFAWTAGVVILLEEPLLRSQFGSAYSQYCSEVPRWLPRRSRLAK